MSTGNWKYKSDFVLLDIFKFYKKKQKESGKEAVEKPIFNKIVKEFNEAICEEIVENAYEYRMPNRLGYLRVRKHNTRLILDANGKLKTSHMHPDWKATNDLWAVNEGAKAEKKIVLHTNRHTQGYYYKWYWDKRACNIKNNSVYSLLMSRTNKRRISEAVNKNDNIDYYE